MEKDIKLNKNDLKNIVVNVIKEMAYPQSFNMEQFKNIKSFSQRVKYCDTRLRKISSGSGRIVYQIDDEKVLKLAKNNKGVAQNEVESEYYLQNYDVTARVFDSDDDGMFVEMELARRLTKNIFKQIVGFNFDLIVPYLENIIGKYGSYKSPISQQDKEFLDENEWMIDLLSLASDYDMPTGDLGRLSSYGVVTRDGQDAVVLIDYGSTWGVYNDYYGSK